MEYVIITILHIRNIYLGVSFIDHFLKGFYRSYNIIAVREIKKKDIILYPSENIIKTSILFHPLWLINKIFNKYFYRYMINDWFAYISTVNTINVDVFHAHMGPEGWYAIPLAKHYGKPLVVTFYGGDMSDLPRRNPIWYKRYENLFREATYITVEGEHMRDKLVKLGCPKNKLVISKISIQLDLLKYQYRKYDISDELRILMCASFVEKKGYIDALNAVLLLKKRGIKLSVDIIGQGPMENDIKEFIDSNCMGDLIVLHGRQSLDYIYKISESCDIFFHPSKTGSLGESEGGAPTVILEMEALGLPIVSTFHADIPNIIPVENQYLAEEGDINGLANQILRLISDISKWDEISLRGRMFIENNHTNKMVCSKMEEIYNTLA